MPGRGDKVTIRNRVNKPLEVIMNGEIMTLHPGDNLGIPWEWVRFAKNQHPVMGTEDPRFPGSLRSFISKVGVVGTKDPLDYIDDQGNAAVERLDASLLPEREIVVNTRWRPPVLSRMEAPADAGE